MWTAAPDTATDDDQGEIPAQLLVKGSRNTITGDHHEPASNAQQT
jgi:hypothetical protein